MRNNIAAGICKIIELGEIFMDKALANGVDGTDTVMYSIDILHHKVIFKFIVTSEDTFTTNLEIYIDDKKVEGTYFKDEQMIYPDDVLDLLSTKLGIKIDNDLDKIRYVLSKFFKSAYNYVKDTRAQDTVELNFTIKKSSEIGSDLDLKDDIVVSFSLHKEYHIDSEFYITAMYGDKTIFDYNYDIEDYELILMRMDSFIEEIVDYVKM